MNTDAGFPLICRLKVKKYCFRGTKSYGDSMLSYGDYMFQISKSKNEKPMLLLFLSLSKKFYKYDIKSSPTFRNSTMNY